MLRRLHSPVLFLRFLAFCAPVAVPAVAFAQGAPPAPPPASSTGQPAPPAPPPAAPAPAPPPAAADSRGSLMGPSAPVITASPVRSINPSKDQQDLAAQ